MIIVVCSPPFSPFYPFLPPIFSALGEVRDAEPSGLLLLSSVLLLLSRSPSAPSASSSAPVASLSPDTARINRATALIRQGHLSRATRALFQPDLAPINEHTVATLDALHPQARSHQ